MLNISLGEKILNAFSNIGIGNGANVTRRNIIDKARFLTEGEEQAVKQQIHKERVKLDRTTGVER